MTAYIYGEIQLHSGEWALVDIDDLPLLQSYKWYAQHGPMTTYAYGRRSGSRGLVLMHRLLVAAPPELDIDHHDGNGLNNRRGNLRSATRSQNNGNRRHLPTESGYRGVIWHKVNRKWVAMISFNDKKRYLGSFIDPWAAAQAYNEAAFAQWGEFANLNVRRSV